MRYFSIMMLVHLIRCSLPVLFLMVLCPMAWGQASGTLETVVVEASASKSAEETVEKTTSEKPDSNVEVEESDGVALPAVTSILFDGDPVGQGDVQLLVRAILRLFEGRSADLRSRSEDGLRCR